MCYLFSSSSGVEWQNRQFGKMNRVWEGDNKVRNNKRKNHSYMNSKMCGCELFWPLDKMLPNRKHFPVPDQKTQLHAAFHFQLYFKKLWFAFQKCCPLHFLHDAVNCNVHVRQHQSEKKRGQCTFKKGSHFLPHVFLFVYEHENVCNCVSGVSILIKGIFFKNKNRKINVN